MERLVIKRGSSTPGTGLRLQCASRNHTALVIMSNEEEFNRKYITSGEITRLARVSASTIMIARRTGVLPDAIRCNCGYVWERERLAPHLDKFLKNLRRYNVPGPKRGWDATNNRPTFA